MQSILHLTICFILLLLDLLYFPTSLNGTLQTLKALSSLLWFSLDNQQELLHWQAEALLHSPHLMHQR